VFVLGVAALTGAGLKPAAPPSSAATAPRTPSVPVARGAAGGTIVDAVASAYIDAQASAAAEAEAEAAEVAASAQAVTSAAGAVDAIAEQAGIWIGVAVLDRVTGQIAVGAEGATPIAAASLTKLYTVVDVLNRAATGQIALTEDDQRWILRALTASDDGAMNALWSRFGGAATVTGPPRRRVCKTAGRLRTRRSGVRRGCRRGISWRSTTTCWRGCSPPTATS